MPSQTSFKIASEFQCSLSNVLPCTHQEDASMSAASLWTCAGHADINADITNIMRPLQAHCGQPDSGVCARKCGRRSKLLGVLCESDRQGFHLLCGHPQRQPEPGLLGVWFGAGSHCSAVLLYQGVFHLQPWCARSLLSPPCLKTHEGKFFCKLHLVVISWCLVVGKGTGTDGIL